MKSSDTSSTTTPTCPPSATTPRRDSFALTGCSVALDPSRFAIRPDLADIRLANRVFAPHYAAPMAMAATRDAAILAAAGGDAEVVGTLRAGDTFDVLEITSAYCWGRQQGEDGRVGYVERDAFDRAAERAA